MASVDLGGLFMREEPRIEEPDLSGVQFRDRKAAIRTEREWAFPLWGQIALGVFLAMLLHSIITGMYARHEAAKVLDSLNRELTQANAQLDAETEQEARRIQRTIAPLVPTPPAPLRDGERCIQGRRFKRLDNGWQQVPLDPC